MWPDRVLARQARDAAGAAHPLGQLGSRVALDVERTAHGLADGAGAAGVHPGDGRTDGGPAAVDGHGARPLGGAADADDVARAPPPLSASARRADATMASHQACGDCSAPPSSVRSIPTAWKAWATTRPVAAKTATFGPPVPRSTASTCGRRRLDGADLGGRRRHGEAAYRATPARVPGRPRSARSTRSVSRPGRPRSRSRSRPCCPPRRCRRAASG